MALFAEPAGGGSWGIGWEVVYGGPLILLIAAAACLLTLVRALRYPREEGDLPLTDRDSNPRCLGLEELPRDQGEAIFRKREELKRAG
jgi:hypothetical protein